MTPPPSSAVRGSISENVFIGPYVVIRANGVDDSGNMEPIFIGANSNIQDGVVIHSKSGACVLIGEHTSIAHRSIVHGPCGVGDNVFIGFNPVLFNCVVDKRCMVRRNSVVEGCELPDGFHIPSTTHIHADSDLSTIKQVGFREEDFSEDVAQTNIHLVKGYKKLQNAF